MRNYDLNAQAIYQPWSESDFRTDDRMDSLNWLQKLFYRQLCQRAWTCPTRPHLPDDDNQLWILAGSPDKKTWDANKIPVRAMFVSDTINGQPVLTHHRLVKDWTRLQEKREHMRSLGSKGGKKTQEKLQEKKEEKEKEKGIVIDKERVIDTTLDARSSARLTDQSSLTPSHPVTSKDTDKEDKFKLARLAVQVAIDTNCECSMAFSEDHVQALQRVIDELEMTEEEVRACVDSVMCEGDALEAKQAGKRLPTALRASVPVYRKQQKEIAEYRSQRAIRETAVAR